MLSLEHPADAAPSGAALGVAVIGTGVIAATHARAVQSAPGLELVAIGSRDADRAAAFLRSTELENVAACAPVGLTIDAALRHPGVDLVAITTPTGTHVDLGRRVLEAGRHLLLEKPVDVDLGRAIELARVAADAEARGLVAAAVSQQRYSAAADLVRSHLEAGRFGRPTSAVVSIPWWRSQHYYDRDAWRGTWRQDGGGALMNQGIHTLDLMLWMLGPVRRVAASSATLAHDRIEVEDTLAAMIEFDAGALATVHATTSAYPGLASRLQLMGTRGSAVIEHEGLSYLHLAADDRATETDAVLAADAGDMGLHGAGNQAPPLDHEQNLDATANPEGHTRQYTELAADIRLGRRPRVTIADAVQTLSVVHAIYRSAASGLPVEPAELAELTGAGIPTCDPPTEPNRTEPPHPIT